MATRKGESKPAEEVTALEEVKTSEGAEASVESAATEEVQEISGDGTGEVLPPVSEVEQIAPAVSNPPAPPDAPKAADKVKLVRVKVADGRTVDTGSKKFGPGSMISLPEDDAARLTALGYLVNEKAAPLPKGDGPTFSQKDGPSVKVAG